MLKDKEIIFNYLVAIIIMLLTIGLIMVYSSSAMVSQLDPKTSNAYFFIKKQIIWTLIASIGMIICLNIHYRVFYEYANIIFAIAFVLILLVLIPGIGVKYNGARRWIRVGGFGFQPSDFMKIAAIIYIARYIEESYTYIKNFFLGVFPILLPIGISSFLILLEPDFGTSTFILLVSLILLLIAGMKIKHLFPFFIAGLPLLLILIIFKFHHIKARIMIYLNPNLDPWGKGYQIRQSLIALGSGGKFGLGLGWSQQKLFFLSEESTDFIFSIIGEELGFLGTALIIILYILLLYYGSKVVLKAPDIFSKFLSLGIISLITLQALFNISVVTHTIPAKGISLPLISFGGSSLFFSLISLGILLNITRNIKDNK